MDLSSRKDVFCPISKTPCPGVCIYSDILDNINLGIIVLDIGNSRVLFQNLAATNLFKDVVNFKDYRGFHHELLLNVEDALKDVPSVAKHTLHYGSQLLGYTAYKILEGYVWIFIRDITEKQRLESIAEAVNIMENAGYIFSGIRHELGNPINSIKMTLSVLKNNLDKFTPETTADYIDRTLKEITRVEYLLKSLKNFSMYESPRPEQVDLIAFMEKLLSLTEDYFHSKGIEIKTLVAPHTKWAYIDPRAFQQVMMNLMSNAVDALEGRENPEIIIYTHEVLDRVWINIADNGCGMTEEQQKNLFKPFHTSKSHGTGLGMVIVKKMLAKMKSTIVVKSFENSGTLVTISLPAEERDDFIP